MILEQLYVKKKIYEESKKRFNFTISYIAKILLGIFIIWVTLAVGALAGGYYPEIW